jgi:hypothetical protein
VVYPGSKEGVSKGHPLLCSFDFIGLALAEIAATEEIENNEPKGFEKIDHE